MTTLLQCYVQNNPHYNDCVIDFARLGDLPSDGSTANRLRQIVVQDEPPPDQDNQEEHQDEEDEEAGPEDQQRLGPFQSGASGAPAAENLVDESYLGLPTQQNEQQREAMVALIRERFGGSEEQPADFPTGGRILSDYTTPGIQAMAFPTLFPQGCGDVTKRDRRHEVSTTDANRHLLTYAVWDTTKEWYFYPFVQHARWAHWAHDTAECVPFSAPERT